MKYFIKQFALFFSLTTLSGCSTLRVNTKSNYSLKFLDEYILKDSDSIGGLSGIDYSDKKYVLISDDASKPRAYTADIHIENFDIHSINITGRILIDSLNSLKNEFLDMETIRFYDDGYLIATEGLINKGKQPLVFKTSSHESISQLIDLRELYEMTAQNSFRNNAAFEALSIDSTTNSFWITTESPLINDGSEAKVFDSNTPIRFSNFDFNGNLISQYAYNVERLGKVPLLPFAINGVTEILKIDARQFIVLERSFSAGYGQKGNRIRLFLASIDNATDVKKYDSLKKVDYNPMKKQLLLDSKHIKKQLRYNFIDNIEGICFGPRLPNGNLSLVLVADNNFNSIGPQLNQFILLELKQNL